MSEFIRQNTYLRLPWKNGLGFTSQIAIGPVGAEFSRGDFNWRLSSAQVETNSEFSLFPGIDRVLVVLEGEGLRLKSPNFQEAVLKPFEPYRFRGEDTIHCDLINGQVIDFNVFTRRNVNRAEVETSSGAEVSWRPQGEENFAFAWSGDYRVSHQREPLRSGDTLRVEKGGNAIILTPMNEAVSNLILVSIFSR